MDILGIVTKEIEMELKHPDTDLPLGIHLMLLPMSDKKVKIVERRIRDEMSKKMVKGKAPKAIEIEENEIKLISSAITSWRWEADDLRGVDQPSLGDDEDPALNPVNVKKLLHANGAWAKDQVDDALGNTGDFFAT